MSEPRLYELGKVIKTSIGVAKYPHLNTPDTFKNPDGKYKVDLMLKESDAKKLQTVLDEFSEEVLNHLAKQGVKGHDKVGRLPLMKDQETGEYFLRASANAKIKLKDGTMKDNTILLFDKHAERTEEIVYGGSKIRLAVKLIPYIMMGNLGITARLLKVQVKEFAKSMSKSNDDFGSLVEDTEVANSADSFDPGF